MRRMDVDDDFLNDPMAMPAARASESSAMPAAASVPSSRHGASLRADGETDMFGLEPEEGYGAAAAAGSTAGSHRGGATTAQTWDQRVLSRDLVD